MTANDDEAATTWQESIAELQSLLDTSLEDNREANLQISSICSTILDTDDSTSPPPEAVLTAVRTIYLRVLINLGEHSKVVEFANNHGDETCINPCAGMEGGVTWEERMVTLGRLEDESSDG